MEFSLQQWLLVQLIWECWQNLETWYMKLLIHNTQATNIWLYSWDIANEAITAWRGLRYLIQYQNFQWDYRIPFGQQSSFLRVNCQWGKQSALLLVRIQKKHMAEVLSSANPTKIKKDKNYALPVGWGGLKSIFKISILSVALPRILWIYFGDKIRAQNLFFHKFLKSI